MIVTHNFNKTNNTLKIDYSKLFGENIIKDEVFLKLIHSPYISNLMFYLKNKASVRQDVRITNLYPRDFSDIFQTVRNYDQLVDGDVRVVIIANEIVKSSVSNGTAFGQYESKLTSHHGNSRPLYNAIAYYNGYGGINSNKLYYEYADQFDPTLETLLNEGVLTIPVTPLCSSLQENKYRKIFLPLFCTILEHISANNVGVVFVLTDPQQEQFINLIDKRYHSVIKQYELDNPDDLIFEIEKEIKLEGYDRHHKTDINWR